MEQIVFNSEIGKMTLLEDAFDGLFPRPTIPDPNFDPKKHPNEPIPQIPKYNKREWVKECLRMWAVKQEARWRQKKAQEAIIYNPDDLLIQ